MGHLDAEEVSICALGDIKQAEKTYLVHSTHVLDVLPVPTRSFIKHVESCPFCSCEGGLYLGLPLQNSDDAMRASFGVASEADRIAERLMASGVGAGVWARGSHGCL